MHSLDPAFDWLTSRLSQQPRLGAARELLVDPSSAPRSIQRVIAALREHEWGIELGEYALHGDESRKVESLRLTLESLEDDLDHELDEALARAGADGGPFGPDASVELCADRGGMTVLGLSWSGSTPSFVVLEFEEDPNSDGLLTHLTTPGALLAYLRGTPMAEELGAASLSDLERALAAAGCSLEPTEPIRSRAPEGRPTRAHDRGSAPPPAPVDVYATARELGSAIASDDAGAVDRALAELGRGWSNSLALMQALAAIFKARDSRPALAVRIADFVVQRPAPTGDASATHEWLGGLLNATGACCQLAKTDPGACARVLAVAKEQGPNQPALFHNLACFHALSGDREGVLEMVELAARHEYADLAALLADDDLAPYREGGALEAAAARGREGG